MIIGLTNTATAHSEDEEVIKALKQAKRKPGGGSDTVIAFKNEAGQIYRYAVINGINQEMYLAQRLELVGIVDETMQGARKPNGVWTVFGPGRNEINEAVLAKMTQVKG